MIGRDEDTISAYLEAFHLMEHGVHENGKTVEK